MCSGCIFIVFFFKQKPAYEMRISDWSSDVCSSDLSPLLLVRRNTPLSIPQSGAMSNWSSKSPYDLSVISIPPLPDPGGSCSPVSTPSATCHLPPVPWPIFSLFVSHPESLWPSNKSAKARSADLDPVFQQRQAADTSHNPGAENLK